MESLTREQLEQAANILTFDMSSDGVIRAWACGTHGQSKLTFSFHEGTVQVKCGLCESSNQWSVPSIESVKDANLHFDGNQLHSIFCELAKQNRLLENDK
jgi:hypothetical protein